MKETEEKIEELERGMTPVLLEDLGMRFATEKSKQRIRYGLYQCQYCGKEFETSTYNVKNRHNTSCGCQSTKYKNPHGLSYHPLFGIWHKMKARCINPKDNSYKNYGARGIKVCDRWLDINNFIEDMYPSWVEGLSIDRIDVNGNYELKNCRWATNEIQNRNTRDIYKHNKSGYRGVSFYKRLSNWKSTIRVNNKYIHLGYHQTPLEAAKAYETYVRLNNLEHNFTPALTEEEIEEIDKQKENNE